MILPSVISAVTVFTDRAAITRTATTELEAGEHTLIFDDLPASIEQKSIQTHGLGNAILGNVKFQVAYEDTPEENTKQLLDEKQKLEDQQQDLNDTIERLEKEKEFLDHISTKVTTPTKEGDTTELDTEKWIKLLSFYSQKLDTLTKQIRQTEREQRELTDQINKINWQLQRKNSRTRKVKNQVAVVLTMTQPGSLTLQLTYIVFGAAWVPIYDLRVSSETKQMNIAYKASVTQHTGEDWLNTALKISTARPQVSGYQPELSPWRVNVYTPQPQSMSYAGDMLRKKERSNDEQKIGMSQMFEVASEAPASAMLVQEAIAETGATAVLFSIAGLHSVQADGSEHTVTILNQDFSAHFRYSTVPKLSPFAYLKAKVTNETDFPFLAGEAQVFLDNTFVATTRLQAVAPTEEFWTYLGIDESFKVEHKFLKKYEKKETQLFSKNRKVLIYEYQIILKNHKKTQEELVVWDQLPISGNEQIKIQLIEPAYKENSDTLKKNELEYLEWFFKPKAGEEILVPFKFSVEYPQDVEIVGLG